MELGYISGRMLTALQQGGIHSVAEAAYEIMGMPVMIADTAYVVVSIFPQTVTGDQQWDSSKLDRQILTEAIIAYQTDGHWNAIREAGGAICIDWGYCERHPKYAALIEKEGRVLGSMAFLIGESGRESWHLDAVKVIAQAAGIAMEHHYSKLRKLVDLKEVMMNSLLLNNISSHTQFMSMAELAGFKTSSEYVLIGISQKETGNRMFSDYILRKLMEAFPDSLQLQQQDRFYILTDGYRIQKKEELLNRMPAKLKEAEQVTAAFSNVFSDPMRLPLYKEQVDSLLELSGRTGVDGTVLRYGDYVVDIAMDALARDVSAENLVHPGIRQLLAYDRDYNTEYLDTLKEYIHSCYSRSGASEALNIHRNTLAYRLEKISEITGMDIREPRTAMHLMISFYYMGRK